MEQHKISLKNSEIFIPFFLDTLKKLDINDSLLKNAQGL